MAQTSSSLETALQNAGFASTGSGTYCNRSTGTTIYTDNNYYKEKGGAWKMHVPGQSIKTK